MWRTPEHLLCFQWCLTIYQTNLSTFEFQFSSSLVRPLFRSCLMTEVFQLHSLMNQINISRFCMNFEFVCICVALFFPSPYIVFTQSCKYPYIILLMPYIKWMSIFTSVLFIFIFIKFSYNHFVVWQLGFCTTSLNLVFSSPKFNVSVLSCIFRVLICLLV